MIAREKAAQLTNLTIVESLDKIRDTKFNVITLWHVLEHVENLNEKLLELKSYLAENGIIFIAVPNHESHDAKIYNSYWAGYDVPRHLWHFSQASMNMFLTSHGLKVINTIPMKQDSFYVSLLSQKYRHPKGNTLINAVRAFGTGLKSNLVARRNRNYSSLVYIATT